jgi:hypothetical protein
MTTPEAWLMEKTKDALAEALAERDAVIPTRIDYILQSGPDKMTEILHGTPSMVASWLKFMPKLAQLLYVRDTEVGFIVTARQYVERFETGAPNYDKPQPVEEVEIIGWPE